MISGMTAVANSVTSNGTEPGLQKFIGDTLDFGAGGTSPRTFPGQITMMSNNGLPELLSVMSINGAQPSSRWEFLAHKLVNGVWLASKIRWTLFYTDGAPMIQENFELLNSSANALDAVEFKPEKWLATGDPVRIVKGTNMTDFNYDRSLGDIDTQAQRAKLLADSVVTSPVQSSRSNATVYLLIAFVLAFSGVYIWNRQRTKKA
jgi:hypothetical protein